MIDSEILQNARLYRLFGSVRIISCFLLVLLWSPVLSAESVDNSPMEDEVKLIWSADHGQGEQVYLSSYEMNNWTPPVQLSDSAELVYHAAVSSGDDGRIWAVWTQQDEKESYLEFTVYNSTEWTKPQRIHTGLNSNKSVTVIVDKNNIPWIAWTGVEKMYPDVFWSRWNGQQWEPPVKIHAVDNVPDIKPALALNDLGQIFLSWETFANGQYETMTKMWDGQKWQTVPADLVNMTMNKIFHEHKKKTAIPQFIKERQQTSLFIKGKDGSGSILLSTF